MRLQAGQIGNEDKIDSRPLLGPFDATPFERRTLTDQARTSYKIPWSQPSLEKRQQGIRELFRTLLLGPVPAPFHQTYLAIGNPLAGDEGSFHGNRLVKRAVYEQCGHLDLPEPPE